jgi:hypothetical protein
MQVNKEDELERLERKLKIYIRKGMLTYADVC